MGTPIVGVQAAGSAAANIAPVLVAGVDNSGKVQIILTTTNGTIKTG